jgi:hypothetical protein
MDLGSVIDGTLTTEYSHFQFLKVYFFYFPPCRWARVVPWRALALKPERPVAAGRPGIFG